MPIRPSSAADVSRLIQELSSEDALRRETASARLAVIGARAVSKLLAVAAQAGAAPWARLAALQTLEAIGDPRALNTALSLAGGDDDLALAAIAVIGAVSRTGEDRAARAFEWLAALALDRDAAEPRRLAALNALEGAPAKHLAPLYAALADDPRPALAARATRRAAGDTVSLDAAIGQALPDSPALVAAMVREEGESTKLTSLRRLIDAIRAAERSAPAQTRSAWMAVRGQVHQILAARNSRLALYDLRETLEQAAGPLPVGFLAAAAAIGDVGCLEPLAEAWVAAAPGQATRGGRVEDLDRWWRDHLAEAFRAIVKREAISRRHPVMKKVLERLPAAGVLVAAGRK